MEGGEPYGHDRTEMRTSVREASTPCKGDLPRLVAPAVARVEGRRQGVEPGGKQVPVDVHRRADVLVAEVLHHRERVRSGLDQPRRARVAEVVPAEPCGAVRRVDALVEVV